MTQYERMINGLIYDPSDEEIMKEQMRFLDGLWAFNQLKPSQVAEKRAYMREIEERDREYYYKNERIDWENLEA